MGPRRSGLGQFESVDRRSRFAPFRTFRLCRRSQKQMPLPFHAFQRMHPAIVELQT